LLLQMLLYFNAVFFPVWLLVVITLLILKIDILPNFYETIMVSLYACMSLVELTRIYLAYVGNLMEKVTELAAFWVLTVALQFPAIIFLSVYGPFLQKPVERCFNIILALFIITEIIVGAYCIKKMVDLMMIRFKLKQHSGLNNVLENKVYVNELFQND
ncbi:hypothetical protein HELRODRAFT_87870, partial [Helobdella robusta]|uniref:Transmembrane protein 17 n=1 Tax=Helobdella robusta TaxID=6412 RepID=T1G6W2_HELRO